MRISMHCYSGSAVTSVFGLQRNADTLYATVDDTYKNGEQVITVWLKLLYWCEIVYHITHSFSLQELLTSLLALLCLCSACLRSFFNFMMVISLSVSLTILICSLSCIVARFDCAEPSTTSLCATWHDRTNVKNVSTCIWLAKDTHITCKMWLSLSKWRWNIKKFWH